LLDNLFNTFTTQIKDIPQIYEVNKGLGFTVRDCNSESFANMKERPYCTYGFIFSAHNQTYKRWHFYLYWRM